MKVLLYSEGMRYISQSGVGRAIKHQMKALALNNIPYTTNPKSKDVDIVHINTVGIKSCLLAKKAKKEGKKVILHAHSTEEDFKDSFFFANKVAPLFKKWLTYSYGLADEIITPTPYSKQVIDSYSIGPASHAVSNGIDLNQFIYDPKKGKHFRKQYGIGSQSPIVLSVGLQIKRKGILDFIKIARKMPHYTFVWCGYTHPLLQTKEVHKALKKIPNNVRFLGYVDDMIGAYSACNLFFMPTYEETEGIVVLEALAMKRPVLIRDIPVYNEWLNDGVNCYKGTSNQEFANKIKAIVNTKLPDVTKAGYKVATERTLQKVGQQLFNIYSELQKS